MTAAPGPTIGTSAPLAPTVTTDALVAELLSEVAAGADGALGRLYDLTAARVYGLVLRVVADPDEAADILRWTYREVSRHARDYDARIASALSWILMLAHGCAVARVRSVPQTAAAHAAAAVAVEQLVDVPSAQLTESDRTVLSLAYYEARTLTEIAGLLGIPVAAARDRVRSGLSRLRPGPAVPV